MTVRELLDTRRAQLMDRLDAIVEMGLGDTAAWDLELLADELLALRDLYRALLAERQKAIR